MWFACTSKKKRKEKGIRREKGEKQRRWEVRVLVLVCEHREKVFLTYIVIHRHCTSRNSDQPPCFCSLTAHKTSHSFKLITRRWRKSKRGWVLTGGWLCCTQECKEEGEKRSVAVCVWWEWRTRMRSSPCLVPMSFIVSALTLGSMSAGRFAVHSAGFHQLPSSSPMNCSSGSLLFISDCIPAFSGDQTKHPFLLVMLL